MPQISFGSARRKFIDRQTHGAGSLCTGWVSPKSITVETARRTKTFKVDLTLSIDGRGKQDILPDANHDQHTIVSATSWGTDLTNRGISTSLTASQSTARL